MTDPTGTESPAPRSTRAKATAMRSDSGPRPRVPPSTATSLESGTPRHRRADQVRDAVRAHPLLIFAVLEDRAERDVDGTIVELGASERGECLGPVDRLRDSRRFVELEPAERL